MIKNKILALFLIFAINFFVGGQVFAESGQIFISKISSKNGAEFIEIYNSGDDLNLSNISIESGVRRKVIFSQNDLMISGGSAILIRQSGSGEANFYYEGNEIAEKTILSLKVNNEFVGGFCSSLDSDCKKVGLFRNSTDLRSNKIAIHNSEAEKLGLNKNEKYEYLLVDESKVIYDSNKNTDFVGDGDTNEDVEGSDVNTTTDNNNPEKDNDSTNKTDQDSVGKKNPDDEDSDNQIISQCSKLNFNEVSANSKEQFVEIINTSDDDLNISNCGVLANKMKKPVFFSEEKIKSGGFLVLFSNDDLKIFKHAKNIFKIVDSEGGEYDNVEIDEAKQNYSFIKINEKWIQTSKITKGEENIFEESPLCGEGLTRNENGRCVKDKTIENDLGNIVGSGEDLHENIKICNDGYFLNEKTNRCNKIKEEKTPKKISGNGIKLASVNPKTCDNGYFLNPTTNRCNKIKSEKISKNTPCKDGYERNPETGRCRKTTATTDKNKEACKQGYERNPDTNRCRKVKKNEGASEKPEESKQELKREFSGWWAILVVLVVLMGIIFWEFRKTIIEFISKIIGRRND